MTYNRSWDELANAIEFLSQQLAAELAKTYHPRMGKEEPPMSPRLPGPPGHIDGNWYNASGQPVPPPHPSVISGKIDPPPRTRKTRPAEPGREIALVDPELVNVLSHARASGTLRARYREHLTWCRDTGHIDAEEHARRDKLAAAVTDTPGEKHLQALIRDLPGFRDETNILAGGQRISDYDRHETIARLQAACAEGRLTQAEYTARETRAQDAAMRATLAELTADLPAVPAHTTLAQVRARRARDDRYFTSWPTSLAGLVVGGGGLAGAGASLAYVHAHALFLAAWVPAVALSMIVVIISVAGLFAGFPKDKG